MSDEPPKGFEEVQTPTYRRTGLRVRVHEPPYTYDLDSFEIASAAVSRAAHELGIASRRLKRAAEAREQACREHETCMREWTKARNAYEVARGNLSHVEAGNVLSEIKALPLPAEKP